MYQESPMTSQFVSLSFQQKKPFGFPKYSFYLTVVAPLVKTSRFAFKWSYQRKKPVSIWQWSHYWKKPPCLRMLDRDMVQIANFPVTPGGFFCWCDHGGFLREWDCRYTRWFLPLVGTLRFLLFPLPAQPWSSLQECDTSSFNSVVSSMDRPLAAWCIYFVEEKHSFGIVT